MLYPIGIQDFGKLRRGGYVYVDKTRHIYNLAHLGCYYFLGRPRRFGKSLLISTMEAYFNAEKDLFHGLAIEGLEKEWVQYPILRLDLNTADYTQPSSLDDVLNKALNDWEKVYGASDDETTSALRFQGIVQRVFEKTGRRVVILVDEYDKPMLQTMYDEALQERHRSTLKAFYSVLKTQDRYIRFAFLTGVTKFAKVSVFSDLNNLDDISMDRRYADICGISEAELHEYFDGSIQEFAEATGLDFGDICDRLREKYDGYHFETGTPGIYNPFSLLHALSKQELKDYWFETGTPTILVETLRRCRYRLEKLTQERQTADQLNSVEPMTRNPVPLVYQSGYLTVTGYLERFSMYKLGFPNNEVETGFLNFLLPAYMPAREMTDFNVSYFIEEAETGDAEGFMTRLQAFYADIDYHLIGDMEIHFHNSLYLFFKVLGFHTRVEYHTSRGSADIVIQTPDYIYIIECKLDKPASVALAQIDEKGYAAPFAADPRRLFKIGVSFSSATRGIDEYLIV